MTVGEGERVRAVGAMVAGRVSALGLMLGDVADLVGVSRRTVTNTTHGHHPIHPQFYERWERVLRWPAGSIAEAYRTGVHPLEHLTEGKRGELDAAADLVGRDLTPYAFHPDVAELLDADDLTRAERVDCLRVWAENYFAYIEHRTAAARLRVVEPCPT